DPVSLDLADSQGARTVYNLQSNTASNGIARTFMQTGGNVEVLVLAGVTGTFTLSVADVQPTARGGGGVGSEGAVQTQALTEAVRGGQRSFEVTVPGANAPGAPVVAATQPGGNPSGASPTGGAAQATTGPVASAQPAATAAAQPSGTPAGAPGVGVAQGG